MRVVSPQGWVRKFVFKGSRPVDFVIVNRSEHDIVAVWSGMHPPRNYVDFCGLTKAESSSKVIRLLADNRNQGRLRFYRLDAKSADERLEQTLTLDPERYSQWPRNPVVSIVVQPDGKVVIDSEGAQRE